MIGINEFQKAILQGIPDELPLPKSFDETINHAPKRKDILSPREKQLALKNALRYFPSKHHTILAKEFAKELQTYGRIYMYRFRPDYPIHARSLNDYPYQSKQAAAIMLMLSNNLDEAVAQHPHELNYIWGQRGCISKLGTVSFVYAVSGLNDRRANISSVFRSSNGTFSVVQICTKGDRYKRNGYSKLFKT
jgi:hypothetical protein